MYYYHSDGLGSITSLTDSSGRVVQTYEYDSFGNMKDQKNRIKQPYAFTAREWDMETGTYYFRARYYDPSTGRFMGFDPLLRDRRVSQGCGEVNALPAPAFEDLLTRPKHLHPYAYAVGNPVNLTDPSGLACGTAGNDPYIPDSFGLWNFTSACTNHDRCYSTCGMTKSQCDSLFLLDMQRECRRRWYIPSINRSCGATAITYYVGVRVLGDTAYNDAQRASCCSR